MDNDIKNTLIAVLTEIQNNNGFSTPIISDETCPMFDLPGFDSLNAVEASVVLSNRFDCYITAETIFLLPAGKPLTIKVIAERITELLVMERKQL